MRVQEHPKGGRWWGVRLPPPVLHGCLIRLGGVVGSVHFAAWVPDPARVVIHAHRAGPAPAPENTLAALEASIRAGADRAEVDVQRTGDGTVVVVHDADLERVAGVPVPVAGTDRGALEGLLRAAEPGIPPDERRGAPLDAFLERARGRIALTIELKDHARDPGLAEAVMERVRAKGMEDEVALVSFHEAVVRTLQEIAPDVPVGYITARPPEDLRRLPVSFLAVHREAVDSAFLRAARERDIQVHVWTVNRAEEMADLMTRGVDGIVTDDPALAVQVRAASTESPASCLLLRAARALGLGDGPC